MEILILPFHGELTKFVFARRKKTKSAFVKKGEREKEKIEKEREKEKTLEKKMFCWFSSSSKCHSLNFSLFFASAGELSVVNKIYNNILVISASKI